MIKKICLRQLTNVPHCIYDGILGDVVVGFVVFMLQQGRTDLLLPMCPSLRLLQVLTSVEHNGSLTEIDALLTCPMWFPDVPTFDSFANLSLPSKDALCHCLFFAINWLREIINAFSVTKDAELQSHVLARIEQLAALEKMLATCLQNHVFQPYVAHALDDGIDSRLPRRPYRQSSIARNTKQDQVQHNDTHPTTANQEAPNNFHESTQTSTANATPSFLPTQPADAIDLMLDTRLYRPYLRELQPTVFKVSLVSCL